MQEPIKMLYQLPNGKVIEISTEQYFEMSDEELEYLIAYNFGDVQEDPWFGSVLSKLPPTEISNSASNLNKVPKEEKTMDPEIDFDQEDE